MAEHASVKTKFELDDHASHVLEHIKEGFEHVEEQASETGHEIAGIFKNAVGTAIGFEMAGAVESIKSIGEEVWEAAAGMGAQEKAIRGVLMMIDEEGASLEDLTTEAHELNEEFANMSVETGAAKGDLISAFDEMAERTGMSTKNLKELTGEMAQAGRAVPGGVNSLSEGFSNLAAGIIRAKNPVVQLIAATGMMHGTAKQIAKEMTKMSPDQAMQVGIKAIEKMSGKMKDVPLSMGETIASLKELREETYETLGTPILAAVKGPLTELQAAFKDHKNEITQWAHEVGVTAGEWVKEGAEDIKEGFQYLQTHGAEIKADIGEAMGFVRDTVKFVIDHKEMIAMAWGAPKLWGASMGIAKGAMGAGEAALGFGGKLATGAIGATEGGAAVASMGASIAALGLFAVAAASVGTAVYEGVELWHELPSKMDDANAKMRALEVAAEEGHLEWAQTLRDAVVVLNPEMAQLANTLRDIAGANAQLQKMNAADATRDLGFEEGEASKGGQAAKFAVGNFMQDLDNAVKTQDTATLEHMASFVTTHGAIIDAMHTAGVDMSKEGAFLVGALENLSGGKGHMVAEEIRGIIEKQKKDAAVKENHMYFTGPITIHQDFKDTNPDRLIIEFKRDLAKSALSKPIAATQVPHTAF